MSRKAAFFWIAYAFFVVMVGTTVPTPLFPIYEQRFGFGSLMVTVIFATYAVGVIAGLVLTGRLSDEIGRRRVLGFGLACALLSSGVFLVAQGVAPLLVGRVLSGLSAGSFAGTATATLIDLAPGGKRQRAAAIAVGVTLGGLGFGNLLSGVLAQTGVVPLRFPYWAHLALLLPAVPAVFFAPETVKLSPHPRFRPQRLAVPKQVRGTFARAALGGFSAFAFAGLFGSVGPSFLARFLGYPSHVLAGAIMCSLFYASVAGQLLVVRVSERTALVSGDFATVCAALLTILALAGESLWLLIAAALAAGAGQGIAMGGGVAALAPETPEDRRGEVNATFYVVLYTGLCVPIIGVGLLSQATDLRTAGIALGCVMAALASVAGFSLLTRKSSPASANPARP
ncbi:MAG TPA: MFS transporter [Thermoleophilaceae bacterium]|jgi:MFS family permease